jgi:nucleoside phosphorylase
MDTIKYVEAPFEIINEKMGNNFVLLVTATKTETINLHAQLNPMSGFDLICKVYKNKQTYFVGVFGLYNVVHIQSNMGSISRGASIITVSDAIADIHPKIVIMIGIAFGINNISQAIGDVLVSEALLPYDFSKVGTKKIYRAIPAQANAILVNRFKNSFECEYKLPTGQNAKIIVGQLLSGEELIDNIKYRNKLIKNFPLAIGGEMEGVGVFAACDTNAEWILIKGICDFADGQKSNNKEVHQSIAINAALSASKILFDSPYSFDGLGVKPVVKKNDNLAEFSDEKIHKSDPFSDILNEANRKQTDAKELTAFAKYNIEDFIGRKEILHSIVEKFKDKNTVLLQGMGGIGKTAIAKAFIEYNRSYYEYIAYIEVAESLPEVFIRRLGPLAPAFKEDYNLDVKDNIYNLIDKIRLFRNTLLIIDNFNNEEELRQYKNLIESIQWKVLITSRSLPSTYTGETIKVSHLSPELAYSLFEKNYVRKIKNEEKYIIQSILQKIKYHTKLTILLAKVALNNPLIKLEEMAIRVNQNEYNEEKLNVKVSIDSEEHPIYEFILLLFKPEDLTIDQKLYLKYFSILPSQDIHIQYLFNLFEKNQRHGHFIDIINKLSEKGWIEKYDDYCNIHPLIQLVIREKLHISVSDSNILINNLINFLREPGLFNEIRIYISYADSLLNFFKEENASEIGELANYASIIHAKLYNLNRALELSSKAVQVFMLDQKSTEFLAQAYGNRSEFLNQMLRFDEAKNALDLALKAQQKLLHKGHPDIATTYSKFASLYLNKAREGNYSLNEKKMYYSKSIDALNEGIGIYENVLKHHKDIIIIKNLSNSYNTLATVYEDLYYFDRNQYYLDSHLKYDAKALELAVKYFGEDDLSTAYIYNNNGLTFLKLGDILKAKEYIEKGLNIRKKMLPEKHPDIGVSLYNLARVYIKMRQRDIANKLLRNSIEILEEVNHPVLASVLMLYNAPG